MDNYINPWKELQKKFKCVFPFNYKIYKFIDLQFVFKDIRKKLDFMKHCNFFTFCLEVSRFLYSIGV